MPEFPLTHCQPHVIQSISGEWILIRQTEGPHSITNAQVDHVSTWLGVSCGSCAVCPPLLSLPPLHHQLAYICDLAIGATHILPLPPPVPYVSQPPIMEAADPTFDLPCVPTYIILYQRPVIKKRQKPFPAQTNKNHIQSRGRARSRCCGDVRWCGLELV